MRKTATVLVAVTVLLAGCSLGGFGGTETASETRTGTTNALAGTTVNDVPGVVDGAVVNASAMLERFDEEVNAGYTDFQVSLENSNSTYTVRYRNDTEAQLYEVRQAERSGPTTYYVANGTGGVRNASTGDVRYSAGDRITYGAQLELYVPRALISVTGILDWEPTGTTTVDGEERYVFEADSINDTVAEAQGWGLTSNNTAVDARLTVGADGVIRGGDIELGTEESSLDIGFSLHTGEGIDVTKPDWYDESAAN